MTAGFGLEYLGIWTLRHRRAAAVVLAVLTAALLSCATQLGFESDIREIFRSDSRDYALLEEIAAQYPASERDVLMVVAADDLITRDRLEQLRALHLELMLVDGVSRVLSIFSARAPPAAAGEPAPLIAAELGADVDPAVLTAQLTDHPLVADKLLSDDATLALMVVSLDASLVDLNMLAALFDEIAALGDAVLTDPGVTMTLTGMPVMRIEIIDALRRDQMVFKIVGFAFGTVLTWLFFRRLRYVLIVGVPVIAALIWQLGAMWLLSQKLNVLTAVVPTLVMVVTFSDALHLLFAVRHNMAGGLTVRPAIEKAVVDVGPACVLTSLTTTLALLSLALVPHPFIAGFGLSGAMGTVIAFLATITLFPIVALAILGREAGGPAVGGGIAAVFDRMARRASVLVLARPRTIAAVSVALAVASAVAYRSNEPSHIYKENLPTDNAAFRAIAAIDGKLAGTGALHAYLRWPEAGDMFSQRRRAAIAAVHEALDATPEVNAVWSLKSVVDWYAGGTRPAAALPAFLAAHAFLLADRAVSPATGTALVTGYFVNVDAARVTRILDDIEARLAPVRGEYPAVEIAVNGIDAVSARASVVMIDQLNRSLALAFAVIIDAIGFAMRSPRASLVAILPNMLPIAVGGTYLYLTGVGLQFTSVVAFTISFGIAVDSTIHMLNRYRLETAAAGDRDRALRRTVLTIGPILLVSTVVLIFGLGITMTSVMPTVQLYGQITVIVLVTALAANMIFLPAILKLIADTESRLGHRRLHKTAKAILTRIIPKSDR